MNFNPANKNRRPAGAMSRSPRRIAPAFSALVRLALLFCILHSAFCTSGANVRLYFQQSFTTALATNDFIATEIATNILSNGGVKIIGLPKRIHQQPDGYSTNYFNLGWYSITPVIPGAGTGAGIVINVYDSGPSLYDLTNVIQSGYNTYTVVIYGTNSIITFNGVTNALGGVPLFSPTGNASGFIQGAPTNTFLSQSGTNTVQAIAAPLIAAGSTNDPFGVAAAYFLSGSNLSSTLAKSATNFTQTSVAAASTNDPSGAASAVFLSTSNLASTLAKSATNFTQTSVAAASTNDAYGAASAVSNTMQFAKQPATALLSNVPPNLTATPFSTNTPAGVSNIVQNIAAGFAGNNSTNDAYGTAAAVFLSNSNLSSTLAKSATNFTLSTSAASSTNDPSGAASAVFMSNSNLSSTLAKSATNFTLSSVAASSTNDPSGAAAAVFLSTSNLASTLAKSDTNFTQTSVAAASTNDAYGAASAVSNTMQFAKQPASATLSNVPPNLLGTTYTTNTTAFVQNVITSLATTAANIVAAANSTNDPSGAAAAVFLSNSNLSSTLAKSATNFTQTSVAAASTNDYYGAAGAVSNQLFATGLSISNRIAWNEFIYNRFTNTIYGTGFANSALNTTFRWDNDAGNQALTNLAGTAMISNQVALVLGVPIIIWSNTLAGPGLATNAGGTVGKLSYATNGADYAGTNITVTSTDGTNRYDVPNQTIYQIVTPGAIITNGNIATITLNSNLTVTATIYSQTNASSYYTGDASGFTNPPAIIGNPIYYVTTNGNNALARPNNTNLTYNLAGAVSQATNAGSIIYLFPGTYYAPTGTISFNKGIRVTGYSRQSVFFSETNGGILSGTSMFQPGDNDTFENFTWLGNGGFSSIFGSTGLAGNSWTNVVCDNLEFRNAFDVYYGETSFSSTNELTIQNSTFSGPWDYIVVNQNRGWIISKNNKFISSTSVNPSRILGTAHFPVVDYGSSFINFGKVLLNGWAVGVQFNGSRFYGTPGGALPPANCTGNLLDADRNITYGLGTGGVSYTLSTNGCAYNQITLIQFTSPDTGANSTYTLQFAAGDLLHAQGAESTVGYWTNSSGYTLTLNDPFDLAFAGLGITRPFWSLDKPGSSGPALYFLQGTMSFSATIQITNSSWDVNFGSGTPGQSYNSTNVIVKALASIPQPTIFGGAIQGDYTGTNISFYGNGLGLTNLNLANSYLPTNVIPIPPPSGYCGYWPSNYDLYWVTPLKTNLISVGH